MFMRKLFFTFIILSIALSIMGQTTEQNLMKYWKHRSQLDDFILKGQGIDPTTVHGSYLAAEHRREVHKPGREFLGSPEDGSFINPHWELNWPEYAYSESNHTCGGLNIGPDATMYLGWYIGVLATEYRLATNQGGWNTDDILLELWSALEAYERLDRMAETVLGQPPSLNGYFLRDDVIFDLPVRDDNGDGIPNFSGIGCAIGKFEVKIANGIAQYNDFPNNPYDVSVINEDEYDNSPSGDQMLGLLIGLSLVKACVEQTATVNGQSVRLKAQNIAHLMGKYARDRNYRMTNANGGGNNGTISLMVVSFPMAEAFNKITGDNDQSLDLNGDGVSGDVLSNYHTDLMPGILLGGLGPDTDELWRAIWIEMVTQWSIELGDELNWPPDGYICAADAVLNLTGLPFLAPLIPIEQNDDLNNSCFDMENPSHLASMFTAAAVSNRWARDEFRNVADNVGMEIFPLLSDVLYNQSNMEAECKQKCKQMINLAPCDAFYSCNASSQCYEPALNPSEAQPPVCGRINTPGTDGWQSVSRYLHKDWTEGNHNCQHNGLDFLLLYNLYHLKYPEELPDYYTDTYTGTVRHEGSFPEGVAFIDPYWYNCAACEEDPMRVWSNNIISSKATITSFNGYIWNPPSTGYASTFVGDVTYRAGQEIVFKDGFQVVNGGKMHAYIDPFECIGGALQRIGNEEEVIDEVQQEQVSTRDGERALRLFPNPNSGTFTISGADIQRVQIMEASGKLVRNMKGPFATNVEVSGLGPGLYLVRVQKVDGRVENLKVIVN